MSITTKRLGELIAIYADENWQRKGTTVSVPYRDTATALRELAHQRAGVA